MTTALEDAWQGVITNITGPSSVAALVNVLDKCQALDQLKERILSEAAEELRADREPIAAVSAVDRGTSIAGWLRRQLSDGERRVQQLKADAARDGIGWRTIERHKRAAGAITHRHDGCSMWSIDSATPPTTAGSSATLTR